MSDRPTPEEILLMTGPTTGNALIAEFKKHGYRIVHPDDIPPATWGHEWLEGYNACRRDVFWGDR